MTDGEALDREALQRLRTLGGDVLVAKMIGLFLDSVPKRLEAVREGVAQGDAKAVEFAAHALKSSAGNLGAVRLQRLAQAMERSGHAGEAASLAADSEELSSAFEVVSELLRAEL